MPARSHSYRHRGENEGELQPSPSRPLAQQPYDQPKDHEESQHGHSHQRLRCRPTAPHTPALPRESSMARMAERLAILQSLLSQPNVREVIHFKALSAPTPHTAIPIPRLDPFPKGPPFRGGQMASILGTKPWHGSPPPQRPSASS